MNFLIINGSLGGSKGNTSVLIETAQKWIANNQAHCKVIHLEESDIHSEIKSHLTWADAILFTSGTYWDSWGSPMQKFLERSTEFEASDLFLGKPAGVMITMHSVGGKGVLSRLQGVLNTMGFLIPPMSGLVYSLSGHLALTVDHQNFSDDFWSLEDIDIVLFNMMVSVQKKSHFKSWPVDKKDPKRRWL